ncbi:GIY-YIG nuclease family protein [Streptomyces bottropensis]|uniref:GIY-YIG nuclease family protein n=1 Tax=Streptomyces bottropensis TaxID=42235 RepID=UPI00368E60F0
MSEPRHFPVRLLDRDAPTRDLMTREEQGNYWLVGPYVYRFYASDHQPLYIGVSTGSAMRWADHRRSSEWWPMAEYVAVSFYGLYEEALKAETAAIRAERPRFNRQGMKPRKQALIKFEDGAKSIAAELHRAMPPELVSELAALLAAPEQFPGPVPPPEPEFPERE